MMTILAVIGFFAVLFVIDRLFESTNGKPSQEYPNERPRHWDR